MTKKKDDKDLGKESKIPIDPDKVAENPGLLPYASNVGAVSIRPEDKGKIVGRAMSSMADQTNRQMDQLKGQIETLAGQAKQLQNRVEISQQIYDADINFEPVPGKVYFLYQKKDESMLLSMIAPNEWGRKKPFESFVASVQLLSDHTWEVIEYSDDQK